MSYLLPHLTSGWSVDQAILAEEDRVVVIRFGHDWDPECMAMDEVLFGIAGVSFIFEMSLPSYISFRETKKLCDYLCG
jgi:hypothetical protein